MPEPEWQSVNVDFPFDNFSLTLAVTEERKEAA
jgi:hypothetical protein